MEDGKNEEAVEKLSSKEEAINVVATPETKSIEDSLKEEAVEKPSSQEVANNVCSMIRSCD